MRTTHDSPSRVDWAPLSDHDEQALEAIRRQLDTEFPHFSGSVGVAPAAERPAARRRGRAATALGLLLACAGGFVATVVFITLYHRIEAPPSVDRQSRPTAVAPTTPIVAETPPSTIVRAETSTKPPVSQRASTTPPALQRASSAPVRPVPDVIRVTQAAPPRREAAPVAVASPVVARPVPALPPVAAPPPVSAPPPVAAPTPVAAPPPVAAPRPVEPIVSTPAAPVSLPAPPERHVAARLRDTLMEVTSEHVRTAWETVKERVVRSAAWETVKDRVAPSQRDGADAP